MTPTPHERLLAAFLDPRAKDVFGSVEGPNQIWEPDPFDVPSIHDEARDAFERAFEQALSATEAEPGRQLLLLGDSGCGKTHLLRAFRASVQEPARGYFAYLHLRTGVSDYRRYLLHHVVDSLTRRYNQYKDESGLQHLSDAIAQQCLSPTLDYLRVPGELEEEGVHECVVFLVNQLMEDERFAELDQELLRGLLLLQARDDSRYLRAVSAWLRCEPLPAVDHKLLGIVTPRVREDDPIRTVRELGRVIGATGAALVIAVDQVEDSYDPSVPEATGQIRRVVETLREASERTPRSVVLLSCLHNFWETQRQKLTQSMLDRLERDPAPAHLENIRSPAEAVDLIRQRLDELYAASGLAVDPSWTTYPFPVAGFGALSAKRTRDVIHACHAWREAALAAGRAPLSFPLDSSKEPVAAPAAQTGLERLDALWSDALASWATPPPPEETSLTRLVRTTCEGLEAEGFLVACHEEDGRLALSLGGTALLVGVCNRSSLGGALKRQLAVLASAAQGRTVVAVRSSPFGAGKQMVEELANIKKRGGWSYVLEDGELRAMLAFAAFSFAHQRAADFPGWRLARQPMAGLRFVREGLQLGLAPSAPRPRPEPPLVTGSASPSKPSQAELFADPGKPPAELDAGQLQLGRTLGVRAVEVGLEAASLTQHAAFIGGTGSGKTTLALSVVEQLLRRGVSAVLVDRKGDLAGYARKDGDARLRELTQVCDVALYTPGELAGRPLRIPLVPGPLKGTADAEEVALQAASAMGSMLEYGTARGKQLQTVLAQAVEALIEVGAGGFDLERLISFIEAKDDVLLARLARFDPKLLDKLVTDLETLRLSSRTLFAPEAEALDVGALLGSQRPRLTIVSTKFLGDLRRTLFFMAQFISAIGRWCSQHPRKELSAVVMLDEADLYLPAVGSPSTKQPLENLLRRGRSAGVGLLLATQSPGDFDYKCRDNVKSWFIGRVREENSLRKLRAVLTDKGAGALEAKIAEQKVGDFVLAGAGQPRQFHAEPSGLKTDQLPDEEILALSRR